MPDSTYSEFGPVSAVTARRPQFPIVAVRNRIVAVPYLRVQFPIVGCAMGAAALALLGSTLGRPAIQQQNTSVA
eukprot:2776647-Prymnesium_polylepis.2